MSIHDRLFQCQLSSTPAPVLANRLRAGSLYELAPAVGSRDAKQLPKADSAAARGLAQRVVLGEGRRPCSGFGCWGRGGLVYSARKAGLSAISAELLALLGVRSPRVRRS